MSRVGKNPILVEDSSTKISLEGSLINFKGALGSIELDFNKKVSVDLNDNKIEVFPLSTSISDRSMWGTYRSLINNAVIGVSKGWKLTLNLIGVGYKAQIKGSILVLSLGYSHDISYQIVEDIKISCKDSTTIIIEGVDRQKVGQVAADIKRLRKADPYKGKGIYIEGEHIIRKEGKKK